MRHTPETAEPALWRRTERGSPKKQPKEARRSRERGPDRRRRTDFCQHRAERSGEAWGSFLAVPNHPLTASTVDTDEQHCAASPDSSADGKGAADAALACGRHVSLVSPIDAAVTCKSFRGNYSHGSLGCREGGLFFKLLLQTARSAHPHVVSRMQSPHAIFFSILGMIVLYDI